MKKLVQFSTLRCSFSTPSEASHFAQFFKSLQPGEVFAYHAAFMGQDVQKMAEAHGLSVELLNCGETNGEFACRVLA